MSKELFLLDTHVWLRYQVSTQSLRPQVEDSLDEAAIRHGVFISVISIWELAMLERAGYVDLEGGVRRWSERALAKPGITLLPLSPEIAIESVHLPSPMHKDPADRILVGSARIEGLTLVTSDKAILAFAKTTKLACLRA